MKFLAPELEFGYLPKYTPRIEFGSRGANVMDLERGKGSYAHWNANFDQCRRDTARARLVPAPLAYLSRQYSFHPEAVDCVRTSEKVFSQ